MVPSPPQTRKVSKPAATASLALLAGGMGGEGFLEVDVGAVAAEEFGDLFDLGAALLVVNEEGVEEHHDAAHQAGLAGFWGLGRPVRGRELGARP